MLSPIDSETPLGFGFCLWGFPRVSLGGKPYALSRSQPPLGAGSFGDSLCVLPSTTPLGYTRSSKTITWDDCDLHSPTYYC